MGAQFLCVHSGSEEVTEIAQPAREVIIEVDQQAQDISFANNLADVLLKHTNALATGLPGGCIHL